MQVNIETSNRIIYEDLKDINSSIMKNVYEQAEKILYKIIIEEQKYCENEEKDEKKDEKKDEQSLNVISFLGERGRGKTSAMLSFFSYLNELQEKCKWTDLSDYKQGEIKFITLQYIDAAMLAEEESIFDVILAQIWDKFEEFVKDKSRQTDIYFEHKKKAIRQEFTNIYRVYQVLQEREKNKGSLKDIDLPAPSVLHELAASMNLRQEMQKLVCDCLDLFSYDKYGKRKDGYLVIAIDDIDMSGKKAHYILEQIRRFLRIPKVIVLLTTDINRLHRACESRYENIYKEPCDRQRFIYDYLGKVLPYNMRIYMPEIAEEHSEILINSSIKEELQLQSTNEKDMIMEFFSKNYGIYFDATRRKRHFLIKNRF